MANSQCPSVASPSVNFSSCPCNNYSDSDSDSDSNSNSNRDSGGSGVRTDEKYRDGDAKGVDDEEEEEEGGGGGGGGGGRWRGEDGVDETTALLAPSVRSDSETGTGGGTGEVADGEESKKNVGRTSLTQCCCSLLSWIDQFFQAASSYVYYQCLPRYLKNSKPNSVETNY